MRRMLPWPVAAALVLGAILRLLGLDAGLWYDEIVSIEEYIRQPVATIVSTYAHANHHVLNSLLSHASVAMFGESAWSARLPAALFGIAGIWAFWFAARELWSGPVAILGTLLMAVSYPHIYYSQSARGYSAFVCFTLLSTGLAIRLCGRGVARGERFDGVGYGAALAAGLYSLLLMAFVAAGHAVTFLALRRRRALVWLGAGIAGGLALYAPMLPELADYYRHSPTYTGHPLLSVEFAREIGRVWPVLAVGAGAGLLLLGRLARRDPTVAALLMLPLAFTILVPLVRGQGVHPRSFMYALPLAHLFLTEALDWCAARRRGLSTAVAAAVATVSLAALPAYYAVPKQGFEAALTYVARERVPGEALVGLSMAGKAARFYDPTVIVLEDETALTAWLERQTQPAWVLATFASQLQRDHPGLAKWLEDHAERRMVFEGAIGDGAVFVYRWTPDSAP